MATCLIVRGVATALAILAASGASAAPATASPVLRTSRGCYMVGQSVRFTGSGFAPMRRYDVTVDGVDFGQASVGSTGRLAAHVVPGGLPAGVPQSVEQLEVSDGSAQASTSFTLTRAAGARFLASRGTPSTLSAPFQVWGFSPSGSSLRVFVHYVSPSGSSERTVGLGRTGGQCGYLQTARMRVFPFTPSTGTWTLQVDSHSGYSRHPSGPVARIYVTISHG